MKPILVGHFRQFATALLLAAGWHVSGAPLQVASQHSSAITAPAGGSADSVSPIISADGRYVLFASAADNLIVNGNGAAIIGPFPSKYNVFLRERTAGTTTLVSINRFGSSGGNGDSIPVELSADARYALFESSASDLVPGDNNNCADIFVRDLVAGTTVLVSISSSGGPANGTSRGSVMTPDGRFVAFASGANNLIAGDTNGIPDIFVRDLQTGTTILASPGATALSTSSSSESPLITPNGRYVAFSSTAVNLVPGVTTVSEIYLRDVVGRQTFLASTNARAIASPILSSSILASYDHSVSDDGTYVVYQTSKAENTSVGRAIIFRYNVIANVTEVVNSNGVAIVGFENARNMDMTADGRFAVFVASSTGSTGANGCVYRWDGVSNTTDLVSINLTNGAPTGAICEWPVVDPSGRYIAFFSTASNLTTDTLTSDYNLYVRDAQAHTTKLVNVDSLGNSTVLNPVSYPCISTNGRLIAFECQDSSLVPNDKNHSYDVFVRDVIAGTNQLISVHDPLLRSLSATGPCAISLFAFSSNGQFLAFSSRGDNFTSNDTNSFRNVFVRDLLAGTNFLVSANSTGAVPATGSSYQAAISGDGRYVAFTSVAGDIFAGANNGVSDVFVRDIQAGTTTLVSISQNGNFPANNVSSNAVISGDGRYVLFHSRATDLAPGIVTSADNLYLRDLQAGTTQALTANSSSGGSAAAMTPDGHFIAFTLLNAAGVFVYDTQLGQLVYSNSVSSASSIGISADGSRLAFATSNQLWVADRLGNTTTQIGTGLATTRPGLRFSGDGRFLAYATTNAVVTKDTNQLADVYLYDFQSGTNLLVSRSFYSNGAGNGASDSPDISADGRFVAYRSRASDIVPGDGNAVADIFLYDRVVNSTTAISANTASGAIGNARSLNPVFSADGQSLAFASWAGNLVSLDHNQASDPFVLGLTPPPFTDSDGDGMDDAREMLYFGTLARNGTGDFDGDGVSDLVEFQTGTDPTDPTSLFHATVFSPVPGQGTLISWPAVPGRTYHVQFKNNLGDLIWQELGASIVFAGKMGYANDPSPINHQRFYRVVLSSN